MGLPPSNLRLLALAILGLPTFGCGPSLQASLTSNVYRHEKYGYAVQSTARDRFVPIEGSWKVDNLVIDGSVRSKGGADYEVRYFVDVDNDGEADDLGNYYAYDLRVVSLRDAGVIWLRTLPLHPDDASRELRVLAEQYVTGLTGTHYETAQLEGELYRTSSERTYAARIAGRATGNVATREAYAVMVDLANVAQLELDPKAVQRRVMLVLVRTTFGFEYRDGARTARLPVLMLAGYANSSADFAPGLTAFSTFLTRIEIDGRKGAYLRGVANETAAQPAAPANTPAAPIGAPAEAMTAPVAVPAPEAQASDQPATPSAPAP